MRRRRGYSRGRVSRRGTSRRGGRRRSGRVHRRRGGTKLNARTPGKVGYRL